PARLCESTYGNLGRFDPEIDPSGGEQSGPYGAGGSKDQILSHSCRDGGRAVSSPMPRSPRSSGASRRSPANAFERTYAVPHALRPGLPRYRYTRSRRHDAADPTGYAEAGSAARDRWSIRRSTRARPWSAQAAMALSVHRARWLP